MHIRTKAFRTCIVSLFLTVYCHSLSFAGNINITGKGVYQLIPSRCMSSTESNITTLKTHRKIKETTDIQAILGTSFGIEFVLNATKSVSTTVKIVHPRIHSKSGPGYTTIHSMPLHLKPDNTYFIGWDFSNKDELQPGEWAIDFDYPNTEVSKFNIIAANELTYDEGKSEDKNIRTSIQSENYPIKERPQISEYELTTKIKTISTPTAKTVSKYLVRGGIFSSAETAEKNAQNVRERGFEPFVFVPDEIKSEHKYYVIIKMFDSKEDAESFAADYRTQYHRQAIPQKFKVKLDPEHPRIAIQ